MSSRLFQSQVYIPPINFNENENLNSSTVSINAIEPLEYNKVNSNLSIKAATENNYGVITTGTQTFKGLKTFSDNLTIYTGSVLTDPTNDTDISNKKYVDAKATALADEINAKATALADEINNKTTDLVKYNTSTKYLIDNKTNSNITNLHINNLSVLNSINGSSASVSVSTSGYHGTDTKNITVYKGYVNGLTCIIFNKNTEINEYHWISDIPINTNGMVMDFSNFSDIYSSLPQMFELKGEASTYGGSKNVATKTLKFVKSSGYKYTVQYDKSYPMNLFKLKESIKNTDTYIFTSEANKIGTLTIDKGYLYNSPTENNNLVNKSYVDSKDTEIKNSLSSNVSTLSGNIENAKTELNGNIENAKTELNGNIDNAKSELSGKIDNAKSELNAKIISTINGIRNIDLTTGTISTAPTSDTDIANKKYVDAKADEINAKADEINAKADEINNSLESLKSYSDSNFVKYDNGSSKLFKSSSNASQQINNLSLNSLTSENSTLTNSTIDTLTCTTSTINNSTTTNLTTETLKINNSLNIDPKIIEFKRFSLQNIVDSNSQGITTCVVVFFKIKIGDVYFINIKLNFNPFKSGGTTLYIKNLNITDIGESYGEYNTYFCVVGDTNYIKAARCQFYFLRNDDGTYNIEIRNTQDGDKICKFDDFECAYNVVST